MNRNLHLTRNSAKQIWYVKSLFQVAPTEVEALILTHPGVADVAVVGKPDPVAGELPMAWVVTKPGHKLTEQQISDFVAGTYINDNVQFLHESLTL